jgi:chorismate mutase
MVDDDAERWSTDDMSLDELRTEIQAIDEELIELIAQRTYVAESIARVKADEGLPITDEQQEDRVINRAGTYADRFDLDTHIVKAMFRLLIELNKVEQRNKQ